MCGVFVGRRCGCAGAACAAGFLSRRTRCEAGTNVGRVPVHSARVSFRLFDAKGHAIGRATDEVHNLAPGQTWKFHAVARGNVSRARVLRVEER
jgi:hypothetical protein